ncbi:MAG: 2-oxoacid:acceptor oxidoreductase family protein [Deltaproteobacteria bacterium]|nr:2-oxoacid:acceptor oxidoreductase family protein [Candidatus Anaeroferrophillacea bacterium]
MMTTTRTRKNLCTDMVIAGVGGQGVVFLSRLLAEAARLEHRHVLTYESHGMAMRGGSVLSHVRLGNVHAPIVGPGEADIILVVAAAEIANVAAFAHDRTLTCVNAGADDTAAIAATALPGRVAIVDATRLAVSLQAPRAVNLVLAGFAGCAAAFPFDHQALAAALATMSPADKKKAANIAALKCGWNAGVELD